MCEAVRCVIAHDGSPFTFNKGFVLNRKTYNLALLRMMKSAPPVNIAEITKKPNGAGDLFA